MLDLQKFAQRRIFSSNILLYLVRIIQAVENVTKFGFYRDYLDCVIDSQTKIYGPSDMSILFCIGSSNSMVTSNCSCLLISCPVLGF